MTTRTQNEVRNFNEAISRCRMPVFLVSSDGTQYNMKSADQEIFTCDLEDEMIMMSFLLNKAA